MVYVGASLAIFVTGYWLAIRPHPADVDEPPSEQEAAKCIDDMLKHKKIIMACAIAGFLGALFFAIEMILYNKVDVSDLEEARKVFQNKETTIFSQVGVMLSFGGFVSLVSVILTWERLNRGTRLLWLMSPLTLSTFSVLSGGRQTVFQLVLFSFFAMKIRSSLHMRKQRFSLKAVAGFLVLAVLVAGYGMLVATKRNARSETISKKEMLMVLFDTRLSPRLDRTVEKFPPMLMDGTAEGIVYFTHSIPMFMVFWDLEKPGPYWGLWEMNFLARRLDALGWTAWPEAQRIEDVYSTFGKSGRFSQIWQTQLRDLIIDFTPAGALAAVLAFGFWCGRITRSFRLAPDLWSAQLLVFANVACIYSTMFTLLTDTIMFFFFMACGIMYLRSHRKMKEVASSIAESAST
jgi:hypothetical protein